MVIKHTRHHHYHKHSFSFPSFVVSALLFSRPYTSKVPHAQHHPIRNPLWKSEGKRKRKMRAHRHFVPFLLLAIFFLLMGETSLAINTTSFISHANTNYPNDIGTANGKASERRNGDRISPSAPDGVVLGTSFPLYRTGRYLLNAPPPRWRRDGLVKGYSGARLAAVRSSVFVCFCFYFHSRGEALFEFGGLLWLIVVY